MEKLGVIGFLLAMFSPNPKVSFGRVCAFLFIVPFIYVYCRVFLNWRWDGMTLVYYALIGVLAFLSALMPSKITDAMRALAGNGLITKQPQASEDK